jgi:hypothetical protein
MDAQLELWAAAIDERPTYHRSGGYITSFTEPAETRSRRPKPKRWQEAAARRRMGLDEREVRMRESDRKLRELGVL